MKRYKRSKSVADFRLPNLNVLDNFIREKRMKLSRTSYQLDNDGKGETGDVEGSSGGGKEEEDQIYFPKCDASVWMRSCEKEVLEPISGKVSGKIPSWLKGTLLRNGPGSLKVGDYSFDHVFDSSAFLHRFAIGDGKVTYQSRFVQTEVYKKNQAAQRIVVTEFGTRAVPDPCQSIFQRVAAVFNPGDVSSDNSMISIYPFGDEYYTFSEAAIIHRVDPKTLETTGRVNVSEYVGIVNHTSHPHVMNDGTVYNVGMSLSPRGPSYNVVCFSPSSIITDEFGEERELSMFDQATIVATVPSRWFLNPSYMHTFGITENYFIIVEQPLAVSLLGVIACRFKKDPMISALKWHENEKTLIHIVSRDSGQVEKTFIAETFFYLHIINQFETRDREYVVLDICCYRDAEMLNCMYIDMMKNLHKNPDYAKNFRGRPIRFILPMRDIDADVAFEENLITVKTVNQSLELLRDTNCEASKSGFENSEELNAKETDSGETKGNVREKMKEREDILRRRATAHRLPDGSIFVKPELLCDLGCETPRINLESCLGREYRYFYAISSDVDIEHPGTIIKVDTVTKTSKTWYEENTYPSEPIFVPDPNGKTEDDGVVLSALVWSKGHETEVGLLILDASSFIEIARVTFITPGPVPKCLHGWFTMDN